MKQNKKRKIYLIGEKEHHLVSTVLKTASAIQGIHETDSLGCISLELEIKYQEELDRILKSKKILGKADNQLPYFHIIISYAVINNIPLLASDNKEYPEYGEILKIEEQIEIIRKKLKKGEITNKDKKANKTIEKLISHYQELTELFDEKRNNFTFNNINNYFNQKNILTLAHICGNKHTYPLAKMFHKEKYLVAVQ